MMKKNTYIHLAIYLLIIVACNTKTENNAQSSVSAEQKPELAQIREEQYDIKGDSLIFKSATIENFDLQGKSIDIYWLNEAKDTILYFYRKYDQNQQLIGAEYYEEGETEPTLDTIFRNEDGLKVEASLNAEGQMIWKSTIKVDAAGNEVLRTYENGKGEYRGLDSLYFDGKNRVIKGFYENSKGKRSGIKTYEYLTSDEYDNWMTRNLLVDGALKQVHKQILKYYQ
ncbi:MAG: hypothetical protein AAF985_12630 [Bacteroidota bacterium]